MTKKKTPLWTEPRTKEELSSWMGKCMEDLDKETHMQPGPDYVALSKDAFEKFWRIAFPNNPLPLIPEGCIIEIANGRLFFNGEEQ